MVVSYTSGFSGSFMNKCNKYGIKVHFKGDNNIKNLLEPPRVKKPSHREGKMQYRYKHHRLDCDEEYIDESTNTFGEIFKHYSKAPSPIYECYNISDHHTTIDYFSIVRRESQNLTTTIKEAIFIRVNDPSLKRNIGR